MVKRIKKVLNVLNYVHFYKTPEASANTVCTSIKTFVCEVLDFTIDRISATREDSTKVLRLLKTMYGMADVMDNTDFYKQNKENTNTIFVKGLGDIGDEGPTEGDLEFDQIDMQETDCLKVFNNLER